MLPSLTPKFDSWDPHAGRTRPCDFHTSTVAHMSLLTNKRVSLKTSFKLSNKLDFILWVVLAMLSEHYDNVLWLATTCRLLNLCAQLAGQDTPRMGNIKIVPVTGEFLLMNLSV